jgi:putative protease
MEVEAQPGLSVPLSALNGLRRRALDELSVLRVKPPKRTAGTLSPLPPAPQRREEPVFTVALRQPEQLTESLIRRRPAVIYLSPEHILERRALAERAVEENIEVCAMLPRILSDEERPAMGRMLEQVKELGVTTALAGELGAVTLAARYDLAVRGDFGIGTYNSRTIHMLAQMGLISATASFEQRLASVRDLNKSIDLELIGYGRLPLMIMQNCIIKNRSGRCNCQGTNILTDRTGANFPVLKAYGCRNELFNSKKLYLADKRESWTGLGLWAVRLNFTTENPRECAEILEQYRQGSGEQPVDFTRGLYFRGVE